MLSNSRKKHILPKFPTAVLKKNQIHAVFQRCQSFSVQSYYAFHKVVGLTRAREAKTF